MSFAVLSPAFRGLQFPFRDMFVLTVDRNSFTGNNGRPSYELIGSRSESSRKRHKHKTSKTNRTKLLTEP